ncbi:MAG: hypothetical protein J6J37_02400 [Bacteroidaceae bacterium]|nr:hypothetical protein [Bacteroidaceae bacterium]MBP3613621.1 hypothetical protein [Bacteroidaceae bacterium]
MKKILTSALMLCSALLATAQTTTTTATTGNDSTVIIRKPNEVRITEGRGYINVEVHGREGNDAYLYTIRKGSNTSIMSEKNRNWDFRIPFIDKKKETNSNPRYRRAKFSFNIINGLQFGMGLVSATSQAPGMDIDMGNGGFEFFLNNLAMWDYRPTKNTSLTMGFGVDWRNYRMKGKTRFIKEGTNIGLGSYPEGADINFSRLKVFSLTLDLMLRQRLFGHVSVAAGPVVNFNTSGTLKTRYTLIDGDNRESIRERNRHIHQKAVTVDFKGELNISPIAFYIKYSPMNVLDTNYGPKFRSLSAGAMIVL